MGLPWHLSYNWGKSMRKPQPGLSLSYIYSVGMWQQLWHSDSLLCVSPGRFVQLRRQAALTNLWHGRRFLNAVQDNWMLHRVNRQVLQWRYIGRDEWCWLRIYQTNGAYLIYQKACGRAQRGGVCIGVPGVSRHNLMPKKKWICFLN
jgi:hypothetical protein